MDRLLFKSELVRSGYTQRSLAKALKISASTMSRKIRDDSFTVKEANEIVLLTGMHNPAAVFFN